jgi:hypothetical protein
MGRNNGRSPAATAAAALGLAVMTSGILSGCGSQNDRAPSAPPPDAGSGVEVGYTLNYGSYGTTSHIDCAQGRSLNVGGSNNTLTVTGRCWGVNIGGMDNRITFEKISYEISVVGLNNSITYQEGDPTVSDLGSGNTIKKG